MDRKLPSFEIVRIRDIRGLHPDITKVSRLADNDYLALPFKNGESHQDVCNWLLLHPILCSRLRNRWHVVGGFRSWQIVHLLMSPTDRIPVLKLPRSNAQRRLEIAATDVLFSPAWLSLAIGRVKALAPLMNELRRVLPDWFDSRRRLHPELRELKRRSNRIRSKQHSDDRPNSASK